MKILSVDTSSKNCSVSITEFNNNNFNIINSKNNNDEKTHSQKLMPLIDEMFTECNLSLNDIDLLSCCLGPGSFTGIRIGVSTVKAFADAKNIPVVGITSLESLAYNISESGFIIPIIDAKNSNIYSSVFNNINNIYYQKQDYIADNIENVLTTFLDFFKLNNIKDTIYFVGDGSIVYKSLISDVFSSYKIIFSDSNIQSSISLAKCGYYKYNCGNYGDSNFISPIYLKKSQAERFANGEK